MSNGTANNFEFPQCWEDDVRMNALFAPFRARSINPTDWDSKMNFWVSLIQLWCIHHKTPIVEVSALGDTFRRKEKTPSCLPEVVDYLHRNKNLISKDVFYQMTEQSWKNWAVHVLIANPLRWTLNKVKSTVTRSNGTADTTFIHWPTVKKLGKEILHSVPDSQKAKLLDINYVQDISNIKSLEVLELLLHWLQSQKLVALLHHDSELLVKFPKTETGNLTITDVDKALFSLEKNKKLLESNIDRLEKERDSLLSETKRLVAAKKMMMAKSTLRRKKTVENVLQKITDAADNIDSLIYQMQMAEMDNVILDCYQTGVATLNKFFMENGLTKDRVMNTRNELEEILIFKSDIDNVLSESLTNESFEDLEEELNSLLKENSIPAASNRPETQEGDSLVANLPDVPSDSPKVSDEGKWGTAEHQASSVCVFPQAEDIKANMKKT